MAAGTLQSGDPIHVCNHCGTVIAVAGAEILDEVRPGRPPAQHLRDWLRTPQSPDQG